MGCSFQLIFSNGTGPNPCFKGIGSEHKCFLKQWNLESSLFYTTWHCAAVYQILWKVAFSFLVFYLFGFFFVCLGYLSILFGFFSLLRSNQTKQRYCSRIKFQKSCSLSENNWSPFFFFTTTWMASKGILLTPEFLLTSESVLKYYIMSLSIVVCFC